MKPVKKIPPIDIKAVIVHIAKYVGRYHSTDATSGDVKARPYGLLSFTPTSDYDYAHIIDHAIIHGIDITPIHLMGRDRSAVLIAIASRTGYPFLEGQLDGPVTVV